MPTEKNGNYQTSLMGGGYPHFGKTPNYFRFFLMKASLTLNGKISVTKSRKSKFWIDSFVAFSIGYVVVYSIFSVGAVFKEKFA